VIADDISYDNFGFMGSTTAKTPTIDQLAQQGTVFTTAYVPTAFCRPSLGTLLTGQWPQHRLHANKGVIALPPGYVTLATRLQQSGYRTFTGGKFWEDEPELRGFDAYDSNWNNFARVSQDKLWQFLDQHAGKQPMFISWAPMLPHTPHNPPQQFLDSIDEKAIFVQPGMPVEKRDTFRQQEKKLLAMNLWFDSEFNKFYNKLAEKNQLDNTLFIFMADNGFSNRAYSKSTPYELGLRTPIIFSWRGHVPVQRIDAQTDTIHLFNTVLDFAGVAAPASAPDSHSLRPVIEQKAPAVSEKLFGADYQSFAMKTDPVPRPERDIYALHVRDGDWKYIFYLRDLREENNRDLTIQSGMMPFPTRNAGDEELYYLRTDGYEEKNLATEPEQQQRLADYRRQVLQWWYSHDGKPFDAIKSCPAQPATLCAKIGAVK
jgi:arylsulfatase A-like enzyme